MFLKKKSNRERIEALRTNYAGESMDHLDKDGNLPFGWHTHNKHYVEMIENDIAPFRKAIYDAETDIEKYAALKSFLLFLEDGKAHYSEIGECVGKYFEVFICDSMEAKQRRESYEAIKRKLKR